MANREGGKQSGGQGGSGGQQGSGGQKGGQGGGQGGRRPTGWRRRPNRVVGKGVRVAEAVRAQAEARGSDKVAGRASLVDVRVDREVVRGKSWS